MEVKKINQSCSCIECKKANYNSQFTNKELDEIFTVKIGNMVNTVCKDCLYKLIGQSVESLNSER